MWERITHFLERVIPVAEEYRIRLACHPHDPGVPPSGFRGVARVLGTVEGLKRFVDIQESPYHGLNLCLGTTAEMLQDPATGIHDVIRYFGSRQKIFNIHFRNIRGKRDTFEEVFPDEGDMDMLRVMMTLKEVDYPYMVMPDHLPRHPDDPNGRQAFAFGFGYIKALIQGWTRSREDRSDLEPKSRTDRIGYRSRRHVVAANGNGGRPHEVRCCRRPRSSDSYAQERGGALPVA